MSHPDDPVVHEVAPNTFVCPDSPEQRARFERMWTRLEARRKIEHELACRASNPKWGTSKKRRKAPNAAQDEAYKQAFRQPQGAYDHGVVARY
jgi:hypothetical protein